MKIISMMKGTMPHTCYIPRANKKLNIVKAASPANMIGLLPKLAITNTAKSAETPLAQPMAMLPSFGLIGN